MEEQRHVIQTGKQSASESRRNFIKTMAVALSFLAGCKVLPVYAQRMNRTTDPNAELDFTTIEITVINNMMPKDNRDLSFKYYTSAPSGNSYAVQEFSSTKSVTKFSSCKAMGFFIRDNAIAGGDIVIFPHVTSPNMKSFTPFCLGHGWHHIPTQQIQKPPIYSLDKYDLCIGPG